jgi:hypothetical protein
VIEQLFGSKTRVKLLHLFFSNPNRAFYVREITRKIKEQINSVRRELSNLLSLGIITSDSNNNRLYYEVNQKYEHYEALRAMFGTGGVTPASDAVIAEEETGDPTAQIAKTGSVDIALLTGHFTRDNLAPVDLLVVGDVNRTKLQHVVDELEKEAGVDLRYTVMGRDEFDYRREVNDRFISDVLSAKNTVVVDRDGALA